MELVIEDLSKSFGERQVLQNISFTFSSGTEYKFYIFKWENLWAAWAQWSR